MTSLTIYHYIHQTTSLFTPPQALTSTHYIQSQMNRSKPQTFNLNFSSISPTASPPLAPVLTKPSYDFPKSVKVVLIHIRFQKKFIPVSCIKAYSLSKTCSPFREVRAPPPSSSQLYLTLPPVINFRLFFLITPQPCLVQLIY